MDFSLLNRGHVNITGPGSLKFKGTSTSTGAYDVNMTSGDINLDKGGELQAGGNGYIQTGGTLYAKGSTQDAIFSVGTIKFNGGHVVIGDASNTYNTLILSAGVNKDTYIDGATFTFKVNAANPGESDLLRVDAGNLYIDKTGGSSTIDITKNGIKAGGVNTWTLIQLTGVGNNIAGDFTTKNLAGFAEILPLTNAWQVT